MREAARRIGISPSYLVALEQGRNPSTGRAPVPSPPILAAIGRAFDIELATLLDASGAPTSASAHLLLYQTGAEQQSPLEAARRLFAGQVDVWIEIVDPRSSDDAESPPDDVLIRKRRPLISARSGSRVFETPRALGALSDVLAEAPRSTPRPRLGIVFGANSAVLRSIENPPALLESETTWEHDVGAAVPSGARRRAGRQRLRLPRDRHPGTRRAPRPARDGSEPHSDAPACRGPGRKWRRHDWPGRDRDDPRGCTSRRRQLRNMGVAGARGCGRPRARRGDRPPVRATGGRVSVPLRTLAARAIVEISPNPRS